MSHESYRIRRKLGAVIALTGVTATIAACSSDDLLQRLPRVVAAPTPSSSPTTSHTEARKPAEVLTKVETRFQAATILAAMQMAEDATNPRSLCEIISPTSIGNKRLANEKGMGNKPGFPGMLLSYDPQLRQVHILSITSLKPHAGSGNHEVKGLQMTFDERSSEPSILDEAVSTRQSLTPQDYLTSFSTGNLGLRSVRIIGGSDVSIDIHGPNYVFTDPMGNIEEITSQNAALLQSFTAEMLHMGETLHHGI